MSIMVTMVVAGHERYFEYAAFGIPSYLTNCPSEKLMVFTDDVERIQRIGKGNPNLEVLDYSTYFERTELDTIKAKCTFNEEYFDYTHNHIFVAALLPMAQEAMRDRDEIDYLLKIDVDCFFAGGDMMEMVRSEVEKRPKAELFLVKRKHPWMGLCHGLPGVGFTLWKKHGRFIDRYKQRFNGNEQDTILRLRRRVKTVILERPGYHWVFPFGEKQMKKSKKRDFSKEELEQFLPAYFHVHHISNFQKLNSWWPVDLKERKVA